MKPLGQAAGGGVEGAGGDAAASGVGGGEDSADGDVNAEGAGGGSSESAAAMLYTEFDEDAVEGWAAGEAVPFGFLAETLDAVQATSKRLEITAIVTNALRRVIIASPGDLVAMLHIALGRVAPPHKGLELGVGDSVLVQAMAKTMGVEDKSIKEAYKKTGDLGLVATTARGKQSTLSLAPRKALTIAGVYAALQQCAGVQGKDSVKVRRDLICGLLMAANGTEALWLVRILQVKP